MCGISIVISKNKKNILNILINSLFQLQNRGYDSAGIGYINDSKQFELYKQISTENHDSLEYLQKEINKRNLISDAAIGHTRWATHGAKTIINTHPHCSISEKIILVHNGIIENYLELKKFLIKNKYEFYSETDSEIILKLIEYFNEENSIEISINLTSKMLKGTWGLGIMFLENESVYLLRNGSPLLFGYNDDLIICTSEISGFNNLIKNYTKLKNNNIYKIENGILKIINNLSSDYEEKIKFYKIDYYIEDQLYNYNHWTIKEIYEQPNSITYALNNGGRIQDNNIKLGGLEKINSSIKTINHIILLGCGTSLHACMLGKFYFEQTRLFDTIQIRNFTRNLFDLLPQGHETQTYSEKQHFSRNSR